MASEMKAAEICAPPLSTETEQDVSWMLAGMGSTGTYKKRPFSPWMALVDDATESNRTKISPWIKRRKEEMRELHQRTH